MKKSHCIVFLLTLQYSRPLESSDYSGNYNETEYQENQGSSDISWNYNETYAQDRGWFTCISDEKWCNGSCSQHRNFVCRDSIICSNFDPCDLECGNHYRCKETSECVLLTKACSVEMEGIKFFSNETQTNATWEPLSEWQRCINESSLCNGQCLVRRNYICEKKIICSNVDPCDVKCDNFYRCKESNECEPRSTVCNGNPCDGCKEDHGWKNGVGFKCLRDEVECVLPQQLLHDDISDCDGGIDLCFGAITPVNASSRGNLQLPYNLLKDRCFQCFNNVMLIPKSRVCDGVIDCDDLSDECLCLGEARPQICDHVIHYGSEIVDAVEPRHMEESVYGIKKVFTFVRGLQFEWNTEESLLFIDIDILDGNWTRTTAANQTHCVPGGIKCKPEVCIPRSSVCDGIRDCDDDERFDYCQGTIGCKYADEEGEKCRCQNDQLCEVKYGTACDGISDCPTDAPSGGFIIRGDVSPEDECEASCRNASAYLCFLGSMTWIPTPDEATACNTAGIEFNVIGSEKWCDGIIDCNYGEDENLCPDRFPCDGVDSRLISIHKEQLCDGTIDCKNGTDETPGRCQEERFFCETLGGKKVNIDKNLRCDFIITCDDESDEKNCNDSRFYCENGNPLFVRERQKFDGRGDCSDWSDECPIFNQSGATDGFSSRYELIANPVLRALVWIMGLLSICGNATVLYIGVRHLMGNSRLKAIVLTNRLLVMNLASADIIMGIYLVGIGIAGAVMTGHYCSQDYVWRTSSTCTTLGVLSVLSSETSVITMVWLTSCRLYAVLKPFKSSTRPRKRVVALMIISSWAISLTIALVPLAPLLSGTFVTHSQFGEAPYFRNVQTSLDEARELFKKLMTYDLKPNVTIPDGFSVEEMHWLDLESEARKLFVHEHLTIKKMFGYYSIDSVCIPKFFITRSDRAWIFSFSVNLFNFCSFTFVVSSYAAIYIRSKKHASIRSAKRNSDDDRTGVLQRKILRLIITDFCCWIPICILAFIKLGGVNISNTAYVFAAIVLLPINSALNPLLYSSLPDLIYDKIASKTKRRRSHSTSSGNTALTGSNTKGVDESLL